MGENYLRCQLQKAMSMNGFNKCNYSQTKFAKLFMVMILDCGIGMPFAVVSKFYLMVMNSSL